MEPIILNTNFENVDILDTFESIIWTDRYSKCGDFEIYTPLNQKILDMCKQEYYLVCKESEHAMIVEVIEKDTDVENGKHVTIKGRSLESILYRRIIWGQTVISGNLQDAIEFLLTNNVIAPTDTARKIPNFIFQRSTDTAITGLSITSAQYTGDCIYDVIEALCSNAKIGFKVTLDNQNRFVFKLYSGIDRSYSQLVNPFVVFSPNFDNIINSNYIESKKNYKNTTLVAGEDVGTERKVAVISDGSSGMNRREVYTDARDISSNVNGTVISDTEYLAQLQQRGLENLVTYQTTKVFDGQVDASKLYLYGEGSFLGDIVQIVDENGIESRSRIDEIVRSQNKEGYSTYPTFTILEEDET